MGMLHKSNDKDEIEKKFINVTNTDQEEV